MLFKRTIAIITAIISVIFVVSLGGCFGGDGETEKTTIKSERSEESTESIESEIVFSVIFDSAGGTKVEAATVKSGEKIPEPP